MNLVPPLNQEIDWQQQADQFVAQRAYTQAAMLYEQAIEADPNQRSHYWHLGLMLLLQGQEAEAQTTWLMAIAEGEPEEVEQWTIELMQVLRSEAERQEFLQENSLAWLVRQHLREIVPTDLENVLHLIRLAGKLDKLNPDELEALGVLDLLSSEAIVDETLLLETLETVLNQCEPAQILVDFIAACLPHIRNLSAFRTLLLSTSFRFAYALKAPGLSAQLLERYLSIEPNNPEVLGNLAIFYQNSDEFEKGIETARSRYALVDNTAEQIFSSHLILRGLMSAGGYWNEAISALEHHKQLLSSLKLENLTPLAAGHTVRLFNSAYYLPYFRDDAPQNRSLQNQVASLCQANVHQYAQAQVDRFKQSHLVRSPSQKRLKVGYLSHCLCRHSVGWLARWLFQHHDRDRVELYGYFINYKPYDWLQDWYANQVDHAYKIGIDFSDSTYDIAEQINRDELDILVDLDSITLDITCEILALKPAPIQATWLGWDAPGLPAVDYFIADPYVLPESAQDYYTEKIWRLPQTYIAIDGFEVDVPTLRRDQLGIPDDAIVYLSTQKGYKRHRDTAKLQMQIIKEVPNSYFLIKGFAHQDSIQTFFFEIAAEVGVERDRLRFLPDAPSESVHRANLGIADVVLDTFPYNGATTTLETLWMGVPIVTRVGEQFAARNSYTMMINAGITEGIAFTDAEYIEWGVRLGTDAALREQIHWRLLRSRQTAPLWNAKQFAHHMENAYEQMAKLKQN